MRISAGVTSLVYVPTHRACSPILGERLAEANWANRRAPDSTVFCLIEHNLPAHVSVDHRRKLEYLKTSHTGPILHISREVRKAFVEQLLLEARFPDADADRLRLLLNPPGVSYGAGPNIAYLLAANLGCRLVHRRDSDVSLDLICPNELPIELELDAVDRRMCDISRPVIGKNDEEQRSVKVVGTGTFGDATFDRRDLFAAGDEFIVALQRLGRPGVPDDQVRDEALSYLRLEPTVRYDDAFYEVDLDGRVEMEACCISQFHSVIPEMPTDILGCDYMVKDLVWLTGNIVLYHSRKMHHAYHRERKAHGNQQEVIDYALRDLQYIQMGRIWSAHNNRFRDNPALFCDGDRIHAERYSQSFILAADQSSEDLRTVRTGAARVYESASQSAPPASAARLGSIAAAITQRGIELDEQVAAAVHDFAFLVEAWATLIRSAREMGQRVADWCL